MAEPTAVVGGVVALLLLAMGGKKKPKPGTSGTPEGTTPYPVPPGDSDPLPRGGRKGRLPRGRGYSPPDSFTEHDLWISPDCQAWVMGSQYVPNVGGLTPVQWAEAQGNQPIEALSWLCVAREEDLVPGVHPALSPFFSADGQYRVSAVSDVFAVEVLQSLSNCAAGIPMAEEFPSLQAYAQAYTQWAQANPAIADLYALIKWESTHGRKFRGIVEDLVNQQSREDFHNFDVVKRYRCVSFGG